MAEDEKYAEMGGEVVQGDAPGEVITFTQMLEMAIQGGEGLKVEPNVVSLILKGLQRIEDRERRLREELRKVNPAAPVLSEPEGFHLVKPD